MTEAVHEKIRKECKRIEEDALHSGKGHYNAEGLWSRVHYCLGIPMTICAAASGVSAFNTHPGLAVVFATGTTVMAALQTFLGASDKAAKHNSAGNNYLALKNKTRLFRELELDDMEKSDAVEALKELTAERDNLNSTTPAIPYCAFKKAKKGIDAGQAEYAADKPSEGDNKK